LERLGINSARTFIEATSTVSFKVQGEICLKSPANRNRNPLERTTIDGMGYGSAASFRMLSIPFLTEVIGIRQRIR